MKTINILLGYIKHRLLHLIWKLSTKKELLIRNEKIFYLSINKLFLYGCGETKDTFSEGMCLLHKPTKTIMIFLAYSKCKSKQFRYTLFHEYIEGNFKVEDSSFDKEYGSQLRKIYLELRSEFPHVADAFNNAVRKGQEEGHVIALMFEYDLAKDEMNSNELKEHLADMLKNRL